jgi:uncharacterized phage protein gp47/JayE
MASLNTRSFSELVSEQVTAIQARAEKLLDFSIGSILRSLAESNAGVAMWLQQMIVKLLVTTRAATCSGEDLDSWMADFSFFRLQAVQASGIVTFSRFTPGSEALIKEGAQVTTFDGSQTYSVIPNTLIKEWDVARAAYVIAPGVSSLAVPVRANIAGTAGNAQAKTVTVITGSVMSVDAVTNNDAFTNGKDAESDDSYRARFVLWIASLSRATKAAIGFAISNLQSGISYTLTENVTPEGEYKPGYFYAVVDDGTGLPAPALLKKAYQAIENTRGFTVSFGVFPPETIEVDVVLMVTTEATANHAEIVNQVRASLNQYLSSLSLGKLLAYTQLVRVAYAASPCVINVTSLTVNGGMADFAVSARQIIRAGKIVVS